MLVSDRSQEKGDRESPGESGQVVGGKGRSWLPVPLADVAIIMSIKMNKFKM